MSWEADWEAHALVPGEAGENSAQADVDTLNRTVIAFDNGAGFANEVIVTGSIELSSEYAGGTLQARFSVQGATGTSPNQVILDIFVEKKSANDPMTTSNWGAANQEVIASVDGTRKIGQINLTNLPAGGIAAGDLLRFKVQRNTTAETSGLNGDAWLHNFRVAEL